MILRKNSDVCGIKDVLRSKNIKVYIVYSFENWAFFLNLSSSTNSLNSDPLATKIKIQLLNNVGKQYSIGNHIIFATQPYLKKNTLIYRQLKFRKCLRFFVILVDCHTTDLPDFRDEEFSKSGTVLTLLISDVNVENRSRWCDDYASML